MTIRSVRNFKPFRSILLALSALVASVAFAAAPQARITEPINNAARTTLSNSHALRANPANDIGAVSPSMQLQGMSIVLGRSAAQQADLTTLMEAQQNPASPLYHQWLTPQEFGARFGAADADIATVESWLEQQGFTIDSVSNSRNRIFFSGTAGQVDAAFQAPLHNYRTLATATEPAATHFAPSTDLSLPSALASVVLSVDNLSDFRMHSHLKMKHQAQSLFTVSQNQAYFLTPPDVQTIYDVTPAYTQGYNGAGQTIAVVGQSAIVTTDITTFQTLLGLPAKAPGVYLVPNTGSSAVSSGDETESDLDLEYSSAMAPGATVNFYYAGNNPNDGVIDALQFVVDGNLAPIVSISYGDCEFDTGASNITSFDSIVLAEAAVQGQTIIASAGDTGSTDCSEDTNLTFAQQTAPAVDYPGSSPYVLGMGGTEFPTADVTPTNTTYWLSAGNSDIISTATQYIPEIAWNDDAANLAYNETLPVSEQTNPISSGGGGASLYEPRPTWQNGVPGIPSGTTRLVPDISLAASAQNPGYLFCSSDTKSTGVSGSCEDGFRNAAGTEVDAAGGTSFDAPIFAGLLAVINQAKGYTSKGQGLVTPELYTLASNPSTYAADFHDVIGGGNECAAGATYCGTGVQNNEFAAGVGYDEATGLGSIDFSKLLSSWPAAVVSTTPSFTISATNVSVTSGTNGTSTVTVTPKNGFTGGVSFTVTASPTLVDGCYTLPNATVSGTSSASSTLTIITGSSSCASGSTSLFKNAGATALLQKQPAPGSRKASLAGIAFAGFLFACFGLTKRRTRAGLLQNSRFLVIVALFCLGTIGMIGCSNGSTNNTTSSGGGTTPTPTSATYTLYIVGTSTTTGTIVSSTSATLTVQQ